MRTIQIQELEVIGGGLVPPADVYPGMSARLALTTFKGIGYVGTAFSMGVAAGQWLNENTPVQQWIAEALEGDE